MQLAMEMLGFHIFFPGQHFIRIAPYGIDFPIVDDKTVRVRPFPAGIGIGGKTGVDNSHRRLILLILQIRKKSAQLAYQKHPLIDYRPAGKGYHICIVAGLLKYPAYHIKHPVKSQPFFHLLRLFHITLHDVGHTFQRLFPQDCGNDIHIPPAQEFQPFFLYNDFKHLLCLVSFHFILREEKHAYAIFPFLPQLDSQRLCHLHHKFMGYLGQDTHPIAGFPLCILACPMLQVFHYLQGIFHRSMAFLSFNIHACAYSTIIVFKYITV